MKNRIGIFISLSLIIFLGSSCASIRSPIEIPVTVPKEFSISGEETLPDQWWNSFNDPVLSGLIEKALSENFSLRSSWNRLSQAEAIARKAGADLFPSLETQAGVSRTWSEGRTGTTGSSGSNPFNDFSLGLAASYELDLWGRIRSSREAAQMDLQASRENLNSAAISLSAQVARVWYQLVEQIAQLNLLRRQLETNEQVLELVTLRFRRGQVGATDVLQQRQLVELRRSEIISAETRLKLQEHQLAILLGKAPEVKVADRRAEWVELPPLPSTGVPLDWIRKRPDIREAHFAVLSADHRVGSALADRFPRFSLSVQGSTSGDQIRDLFDNWPATIAANLVAPLIDGGDRRAEVERTRAVLSQTLNDYAQVILESLGEVEDSLTQELKQRELIESLSKQFNLSLQVIQRVRDNYTHGGVDYLRVLDALLTHQLLERTLLEERRRLFEFRINLCRAIGGGWELNPTVSVSERGRES